MASAGAVGNRPTRARNQTQVIDSIVEPAVGKSGCLEADIWRSVAAGMHRFLRFLDNWEKTGGIFVCKPLKIIKIDAIQKERYCNLLKMKRIFRVCPPAGRQKMRRSAQYAIEAAGGIAVTD
jgi:hypothetical protein